MKSFKSTLTLLFFLFIFSSSFSQLFNESEDNRNKAENYMKYLDYKNALYYYQLSFKQGNTNCDDYYNAGCAAAKQNQPDSAFKYLKSSIQNGFTDKEWIMKDEDLTSIRGEKEFDEVLKEFEALNKKLEAYFVKIKSIPNTDLIPFSKNEKWGYLNRKTKKIVVDPIFKDLSFMGSCAEFRYKDESRFIISAQGKIIKIIPPISPYGDASGSNLEIQVPVQVSSKNGFIGFNLNEKNEIVSFSDIYNRNNNAIWDIQGPILIQNKYYALVQKDSTSGIIDQKGNTLKGFEFVHSELEINYYAKDSLKWFYFRDKFNKRGFINQNGVVKLYDEFTQYPFHSQGFAHFEIFEVNDLIGVMDFEKMEWVIKPQKIQIANVACSINGECVGEIKSEQVVKPYFLILEENGNAYYIDKDMNEYKPK